MAKYMNEDKLNQIEVVWTRWLTKDIRQWLSFPKAVLKTCQILGED